MRRVLIAAAALAWMVAGAAEAQHTTGSFRRFTTDPGDTNRSNKIIYVPIGMALPGQRPAQGQYEWSTATWFLQPLGSAGVRPDKKLGDAEYVLERFESVKGAPGQPGRLRVVITRRGGGSEPAPELRVTDPQTHITSRAQARVTPIPGGSRYEFLVQPPLAGLFPGGQTPARDRYELQFMSSTRTSPPPALARRPTFGGEDPELRALAGPPRLPKAERVAGKRLEFRSARSGGVVTDQRVAGKRQEFRDRGRRK